MLIGAPANF